MSGFVGNDGDLVDVVSDPLHLPDNGNHLFAGSGLQPHALNQSSEIGVLGYPGLGRILVKSFEFLLGHTGTDPPVSDALFIHVPGRSEAGTW